MKLLHKDRVHLVISLIRVIDDKGSIENDSGNQNNRGENCTPLRPACKSFRGSAAGLPHLVFLLIHHDSEEPENQRRSDNQKIGADSYIAGCKNQTAEYRQKFRDADFLVRGKDNEQKCQTEEGNDIGELARLPFRDIFLCSLVVCQEEVVV